jgi:hypothetical protein
MSKPPRHVPTSIYETSHWQASCNGLAPKANLNLALMTWEHIFQAIYISFSDSYLVHEMSLRQKGTCAPPQDKARGLNIHDGK